MSLCDVSLCVFAVMSCIIQTESDDRSGGLYDYSTSLDFYLGEFITPNAQDCWDTLGLLIMEDVEPENSCPVKCACSSDELHGEYVSCDKADYSMVPQDLNKNTTLLSMIWTHLAVLLPGSFDHIPNLHCLRVMLNLEFHHLRARSFVGLKLLNILMLQMNQIKTLEDDTFFGLGNLEHLDLSRNLISELSDNVFSPLINLTFLNLEYNYLTGELAQEALVSLTQLKLLNVRGNFLGIDVFCYQSSADDDSEIIFQDLEVLVLSANSFVYYNTSSCLFDVEELYMEKIPILTDRYFLKDLKNVNMLKLKGSKFTQSLRVAPGQVNFWQNVDTLPFVTFNNMVNTKILDISGTEGVILSNQTFTNSTGILEICLDRLRITSKDRDLFTPLINLKRLYLAYNEIETVNFSFLPSRFWTELEEIDLSKNPFSCDCDIMWFHHWLRTTNVTVVQINDSSAYTCSSPQEMKDKPILSININHCYAAPIDFLLHKILTSLFLLGLISSVASLMHKFRWHVRYWQFQVQSRRRLYRAMTTQQVFAYDAFVMYSSEDSEWVKQHLLCQLESDINANQRLRLCLHERDWLAGALIVDNIVESIESSRKCLLIVSNAFITSNWCNYEMNLVQSRNIEGDCSNTVLVFLDEIAPINMTPRLHREMQRQTYIEWTEDEVGQRLFWTRLKQALNKPDHSLVHETPPRSALIELN